MFVRHALQTSQMIGISPLRARQKWCVSTTITHAVGSSAGAEAGSPAHVQRMMDGPDLSLMSYPNLGQIAGMLEKDAQVPQADARAMLDAPSSTFTGGLYFDGPAVFGSVVLFSLMIALSFGRVLGVDAFLNRTLREWQEQKRERERLKIMEARQQLEKQYEQEE